MMLPLEMLLVPLEEVAGYLIAAAVVIALIVMVIVYVILPLLGLIAVAGLCYGGYFAISNYATAFNKITIEGNQR